MLNATVKKMHEQQDIARAEQRVAERRANASVQALTDVRAALDFPVDTVN